MLLSNLLPLAIVAPLAFAGPVLHTRATPAQTNAIVADIAGIASAITTLNNTLNGFKPNDPLGFITALKVQQQTNDIGSALEKAISDVGAATKTFNKAQSLKIAEPVLNLNPVIFGLLDNIVAHKPAFATAIFFFGDISKTVRASLVKQKGLSNTFGTNLAAKLAEPFKDLAPGINQAIQDRFTAAIKAYDACTGKVCLPPIPSIPSKE